mmetsp:Transcript_112809/g.329649  ORF Transcript_112809/g.329649 Transcript_112809/m.329649 type:complete len:259 (+) Transcript_112809:631-1407(+)
MASRKVRRAACEMSAAPLLSCLKSASGFRPDFRTWARRAAITASCASASTCRRAARIASTCFWQRDSQLPSFTFSLTSTPRASEKGPLMFTLISSRCTFSWVWPLSTASSAAWSSRSAASIAAMGLSRSAPPDFTRASAAGTHTSTRSCSAVTAAVLSSIMVLAVRRSIASWRRFFSASMPAECLFCASRTFFFNADCKYCTFTTRGLSFMSSALVSTNGPVFTPRSSSAFLSTCFVASRMASVMSCKARSTLFSVAL